MKDTADQATGNHDHVDAHFNHSRHEHPLFTILSHEVVVDGMKSLQRQRSLTFFRRLVNIMCLAEDIAEGIKRA